MASPTATHPRSRQYHLRAALAERWFLLGIAGCAAVAGTFLLTRLHAWPPHEDEALALFDSYRLLRGLGRA